MAMQKMMLMINFYCIDISENINFDYIYTIPFLASCVYIHT